MASIAHIIPILESTSLTVLETNCRDFHTWKLSNPDFPSLSYNLGFASVRIAELWIGALEAVIGRAVRTNGEARQQEAETIRMLRL